MHMARHLLDRQTVQLAQNRVRNCAWKESPYFRLLFLFINRYTAEHNALMRNDICIL